MSLEDCLPAHLQGPSTSITRVAAGLSGAGVYRVDVATEMFVLKVSREEEPLAEWQRKVHIQQLAATSGLAPRVIHVDEARRAVVSDFVVDRSFPAFFMDPRTREAALALLGQMLRRVHELPLPPDADTRDAREFLVTHWSKLETTVVLPGFVVEAVQRVLSEVAPASERALVMSHNDVNPSNLVYDGENLLLVDWDTAGLNDPYYDLAAIAVFARMDDATCQHLIAAYDNEPVSALPARFTYDRRLVAVMAGAIFLRMAHYGGHTGATGEETLDSATSLGEFYQRMRSGALSVATTEGQWTFGLALVKESVAL